MDHINMDHIKRIGQRIYHKGYIGTIKYSGPLIHTKDPRLKPNSTWLGIEWDDCNKGKHNGTVEGVKYFVCDDGKNGSLVRLDTLPKKLDILEGYIKRYFRNNKIFKLLDESRSDFFKEMDKVNIQQEQIKKNEDIFTEDSIYVQTSISQKKIEFYGFTDIWSKIEDLSTIQNFSIDRLQIGRFENENLGDIFKNLKELSLEENLIFNWSQVNQLSEWFHKLEFLNLNHNYIFTQDELQSMKQQFALQYYNNIEVPKQKLNFKHFENLKIVSLSYTNMTCKKFNKVKQLFQNVKELVLSNNNFNDFNNLEITENDFKNLEKIDLSSNNIVDLDGIQDWKIKNLLQLNLHQNQIQDFKFYDIYKNLETLNISKNQLNSLDILHSMSKLEKLNTLKISKNLLAQYFDTYYLKSMFVSCLPKLKVLNGSELQKRERRDLEIYYLKNAYHEFFEHSKTNEFTYDKDQLMDWIIQKFPRIEKFIRILGSPYPYEERFLTNRGDGNAQNNLDNSDEQIEQRKHGRNFCMVKFILNVKKESKEIMNQKLPLSTDFLFLKTYLKKALKLEGQKIKLYAQNSIYKIHVDYELDTLRRYFQTQGKVIIYVL